MANRDHYRYLLNFFVLASTGLDNRDIIDALRDSKRLEAVDDREDETVEQVQARYTEREAQQPRTAVEVEQEEENAHREKCRAVLAEKNAEWPNMSEDQRTVAIDERYQTEKLLFGQLDTSATGEYAQRLILREAALLAIRSRKAGNVQEQCALLSTAALAYEAGTKTP